MSATGDDGFVRVIRFLFSWPDRTLADDWRSTYEPVGLGAADVAASTRDIVRRYLRLRRKAAGWNPRRYDTNSHRAIPRADVEALLADAARLDRGERPQAPRAGRRAVRRSQAVCGACGGVFSARRSTARFCGPACRVRAHRATSGENVTLSERETAPVPASKTQSPTDPSNGALSVTGGRG